MEPTIMPMSAPLLRWEEEDGTAPWVDVEDGAGDRLEDETIDEDDDDAFEVVDDKVV